jgi:hypothetical protein
MLEEMLEERLKERLSANSNEILVIFTNRYLMQWCIRAFKRNKEIVCVHYDDLVSGEFNLHGKKFRKYVYADEAELIKLKKGVML